MLPIQLPVEDDEKTVVFPKIALKHKQKTRLKNMG